MSDFKEGDPLPLWEGQVIYTDTTNDGKLAITVWRDDEPDTVVTQNFGCMGTLRVYDLQTTELYHEERLLISPGTLYGPGPNLEDMEKWLRILKLFGEA